MINLKEIRLYPNRYVDGQLDDGRLVEFKTKIPHQLDNLIRMYAVGTGFFDHKYLLLLNSQDNL